MGKVESSWGGEELIKKLIDRLRDDYFLKK